MLNDSDVLVRGHAAAGLGLFGSRAGEAVPDLIRALQDSDKNVWWSVVSTLGEIGSEAKPAISSLIKMLKDKEDEWEREIVLRASKKLIRPWSPKKSQKGCQTL